LSNKGSGNWPFVTRIRLQKIREHPPFALQKLWK
jgi:hypothetical protein